MTKPSTKEMKAVLELDGPSRFKYFVKRVADDERAWGLYKDGWALMADADGTVVFPLWPAREYAELCAVDDWTDYKPMEIRLDELLGELIPKLRQSHAAPGVFPTPKGTGVTPGVDVLCEALREELAKYQ